MGPSCARVCQPACRLGDEGEQTITVSSGIILSTKRASLTLIWWSSPALAVSDLTNLYREISMMGGRAEKERIGGGGGTLHRAWCR